MHNHIHEAFIQLVNCEKFLSSSSNFKKQIRALIAIVSFAEQAAAENKDGASRFDLISPDFLIAIADQLDSSNDNDPNQLLEGWEITCRNTNRKYELME